MVQLSSLSSEGGFECFGKPSVIDINERKFFWFKPTFDVLRELLILSLGVMIGLLPAIESRLMLSPVTDKRLVLELRLSSLRVDSSGIVREK